MTEIAEELRAEGTPVSAQTVWAILHAEGLERLGRGGRAGRHRAPTRSGHAALAVASRNVLAL